MRSLRPVLGLVVLAAVDRGRTRRRGEHDDIPGLVGEGAGDPVFPDITTIVVSNNDAGMVTFKIQIPKQAAVRAGS